MKGLCVILFQHADVVIDTDGPFEQTRKRVRRKHNSNYVGGATVGGNETEILSSPISLVTW